VESSARGGMRGTRSRCSRRGHVLALGDGGVDQSGQKRKTGVAFCSDDRGIGTLVLFLDYTS
jgi:hypothetical protein